MAMTLITSCADTGVGEIDFTSGIDNTYKLYIFKFYDVNPATDSVDFTFQVNATDNTGYNNSLITSTYFDVYHSEADGTPALEYRAANDLAQAANFQLIAVDIGNGADESCAGELYLFNPSSTTYAKHFYANTHYYHSADTAYSAYAAGLINDTTAIDDIRFKMSEGDMDAVIKMYGVG